MRTIKLLNGTVEACIVKGEKNPCGCGSNIFHYEKDHDENKVYGVCNACGRDIYEHKDNFDFKEWKYKNPNDLLTIKEKIELAYYFQLGYRYICKDINNEVQLSKKLPIKENNNWKVACSNKQVSMLKTFQIGKYEFLTWDMEPFKIKDLL